MKLLQTHFPLGFNDNIYHQGNISKMPDFDVLSLLNIRRRNRRSRGKRNQRTNGPENAHLISWPSKAENIQNLEKYMVNK